MKNLEIDQNNLSINKKKEEKSLKVLLQSLSDYLVDNSSSIIDHKINILTIEMEARKIRDKIFPKSLFGEASWDMLLDLYINHLKGKKVSIKAACIASKVPNTTALRYIKALEDNNLISRYKDNQDSRITILQLTEQSIELMAEWTKKLERKYNLRTRV